MARFTLQLRGPKPRPPATLDAAGPTARDDAPAWEDAYTGSGRTALLSSLRPGTLYEARARAAGPGGDSGWSKTCSATTPAAPPSAPRALRVQLAAGSAPPAAGTISLAWEPPAEDGGQPVLSYCVQAAPAAAPSGDGLEWADSATVPEAHLQLQGLRAGGTYALRCAAVSAAGQSPWSEPLSATAANDYVCPFAPAVYPPLTRALQQLAIATLPHPCTHARPRLPAALRQPTGRTPALPNTQVEPPLPPSPPLPTTSANASPNRRLPSRSPPLPARPFAAAALHSLPRPPPLPRLVPSPRSPALQRQPATAAPASGSCSLCCCLRSVIQSGRCLMWPRPLVLFAGARSWSLHPGHSSSPGSPRPLRVTRLPPPPPPPLPLLLLLPWRASTGMSFTSRLGRPRRLSQQTMPGRRLTPAPRPPALWLGSPQVGGTHSERVRSPLLALPAPGLRCPPAVRLACRRRRPAHWWRWQRLRWAARKCRGMRLLLQRRMAARL